MIQVDLIGRLWIPPKPGGKPREVLADEALCDEIIKAAIACKSALIAARASVEAIAACDATPDLCGACDKPIADHRADGRYLDCPPGPDPAGGDGGELPAPAGDPDPGLADACLLPGRVAELLATPPGTIGGNRGDVVSRAEILYGDGTSLAAPAESWEILRALSKMQARLVRTWDIDWTGDQPRAVNEVQFTGEPQASRRGTWVKADPAAGGVPYPCAVVGCGHTSQSHWEVTEPDGPRKGCAVLGCACTFYAGAADVLAESIATGRPVIVEDDGYDEAAVLAAGELAAAEVDEARDREPRSDSAVSRGQDDGGEPSAMPERAAAWPAVPFLSQEPALAAAEAAAGPRLVVPLIAPRLPAGEADPAADGAELPRPFALVDGFAELSGLPLSEAARPVLRPVRIGVGS